MMAVLGGIILASRLRSVDTNTGGGQALLYPIAAAVIGGTSLFGGRGTMKAALLGALVMLSIDNGLGLLGLSSGHEVRHHRRRAAARRHGRLDLAPRAARSPDEHERCALGLLSTARINRQLLGGARGADGVEVVAVGSRDRGAGRGVRGRARDRARARLLRGAARRPGGRRGLHPAAQLAARAVVGARAGGGQARAVREAADAAAGGGRGGVRRRRARRAACWWRRSCGATTRRRGGSRELVATGAVGRAAGGPRGVLLRPLAPTTPATCACRPALDGGGADGRRLLLRERLRLLAASRSRSACTASTRSAATASTSRFAGTLRFPATCSARSTAASTSAAATSLEVDRARTARCSSPTRGTARDAGDRAAARGRDRGRDRGRARRPLHARARRLRARACAASAAAAGREDERSARRATIEALYASAADFHDEKD